MQTHRILVIDDNLAIHDDFRKILCEDRSSTSALEATEAAIFRDTPKLGSQRIFQVDSAYQGEEGLAKVHHAIAESNPYEIAFLDVRMPPGWDGIEVAPRLLLADPALEIVICTAFSDYTWEEMFQRLGTSERMFILKKPFDRIEVLQLAHSLSEKRRIAQERRSRTHSSAHPATMNNSSQQFRTELIRLKKRSPGA